MAKFNLIHEKQLEKERESQKLGAPESLITDKLLKEKRNEEDGDTLTEKLLDKDREDSVGHQFLEKMLDKHDVSDDLPARTGKDKHDVIPINALVAVNENKISDAFDKARKLNNKELVDNIVTAPKKPQSQLHNDPERFNNLDADDVKNNKGVRKMVSASLKDADAMLYYIYRKALTEKRELSNEEENLVNGISNDKAKILEVLFDAI